MPTFMPPASSSDDGDRFTAADAEGHALLIYVTEYVQGIETVHGEGDAVKVNVHDFNTGDTHHGALWFPKVLVGSLKGRVGQYVLGRMGKGEAKPGKSAPWQLEDLTTNDKAVAAATKWLADNPGALEGTPDLAGPDAADDFSGF